MRSGQEKQLESRWRSRLRASRTRARTKARAKARGRARDNWTGPLCNRTSGMQQDSPLHNRRPVM